MVSARFCSSRAISSEYSHTPESSVLAFRRTILVCEINSSDEISVAFQIINTCIQKKIIDRIGLQYFRRRLLVIADDFFPETLLILAGNINDTGKNVGMITVDEDCLREKLHFLK